MLFFCLWVKKSIFLFFLQLCVFNFRLTRTLFSLLLFILLLKSHNGMMVSLFFPTIPLWLFRFGCSCNFVSRMRMPWVFFIPQFLCRWFIFHHFVLSFILYYVIVAIAIFFYRILECCEPNTHTLLLTLLLCMCVFCVLLFFISSLSYFR